MVVNRVWMAVVLALATSFAHGRSARAADAVSFTRDIAPILRANCVSCHRADRAKGKLDVSTYDMLMKGGSEGASVVAGKPGESLLIKLVTGPEPEMPAEGEPLSAEEIAILSRWIEQGAVNDESAEAPASDPIPAPVYTAPPVIAAMAYSPDGKLLAIGGYHEIILHHADGDGIVARLVGRSPRIEAVAFSPDGKHVAAAGGSPGEFGHLQVWNVESHALEHEYTLGSDSLYGLGYSPDGRMLAVGGAEKIVRLVRIADGEVLLDFRAHGDWVRGVVFTADGHQLVSAGRDKAMKLIDLDTARFVDDINNPLEPIVSVARHPAEALIAYGGELGVARIYKISDNQNRTAARNDTNLVKTFERLGSPVAAVAFSADGKRLAIGATNEVRIYDIETTSRALTLTGFDGPVYALEYSPDGATLATAGYDGQVRLFSAEDGRLIKAFVPVPVEGVRGR